VHSKNPLYIL